MAVEHQGDPVSIRRKKARETFLHLVKTLRAWIPVGGAVIFLLQPSWDLASVSLAMRTVRLQHLWYSQLVRASPHA